MSEDEAAVEEPLDEEPDGSDVGDLGIFLLVALVVGLLVVLVWLFFAYMEGSLRMGR